jgi:hypothetical protein
MKSLPNVIRMITIGTHFSGKSYKKEISWNVYKELGASWHLNTTFILVRKIWMFRVGFVWLRSLHFRFPQNSGNFLAVYNSFEYLAHVPSGA